MKTFLLMGLAAVLLSGCEELALSGGGNPVAAHGMTATSSAAPVTGPVRGRSAAMHPGCDA